jgi:hypothetical protein
MRSQDCAEDRDDRGCEQYEMRKPNAPQYGSRIARRRRVEPPVRERLADEYNQHEHDPNCGHEPAPPERRVGKAGPEIEPPSHPESRRPGKRDGNARLGCEAALDGFEQRPAFPARASSMSSINGSPGSSPLRHSITRVFIRSGEGQRDEGDEGDAADPVNDAQDVKDDYGGRGASPFHPRPIRHR